MKAVLMTGDKQLQSAACVPVAPGPGEVQIEVAYAGICGTDLHIYLGHMNNRIRLPHVMGHEMSGVVRAVGKGVDSYAPGDNVTVRPLDPCGECDACKRGCRHICRKLKFLGIETPGAFQSLWTVPAHTLHKLPQSLSLKLGALIEPLAVACHDVRLGEVRPGEFAVVLGGGPIGTLIAMVAREAGARVVISEINPYRIELLSELGFETVNPKETDFAAFVEQETQGAGADVVFEVTSSAAGAALMTQLPRIRGRIVIVGIFSQPASVDLHRFFWRELRLLGARVYEEEDFEHAIRLADSGRLPLERIISGIYPLEDAGKGFEEMETGGRAMKILLSCQQ
ncbi:zinc-binding dehydrogenase [Paenibacillaceae bacterium WGS1546]|uniref:zinc-dependent alcohol dehydrogenase n=1 Tax=Cohnella sp. WGS1546 TaxID=3366810 RepID=UPI00372D6168